MYLRFLADVKRGNLPMKNIKILEKNVSDKIAAGEVVERPASVIKELLENAVDAKATVVCVEIKNGGISYMRVTDNGIGIAKEDVSLSIVRHATSKISTEDDLTRISTLGFRGEALSSICAVSKLEIYTKPKNEETGTHLIAENGEIIDISDAGCPDGTTVVVRDLFSTVPARMKFLKKDFTEAGYIEDIVVRLALSHPEISVKYINNGKEVIFTPGDNLLSSAISAVYGKDIKNAMISADFIERYVRVYGMCAKGTAARGNRGMENFFVNGRYIKSPLLSRAAEEAYKNELMVGKFPVCVINIELPPENVDINVHPTKLEAKFSDEKEVYHCVYWAVKNALYSSEFIPKASEHKSIKPQYERKLADVLPQKSEQKEQIIVDFGAKEIPKSTEIVYQKVQKNEESTKINNMSFREIGGTNFERPKEFEKPIIKNEKPDIRESVELKYPKKLYEYKTEDTKVTEIQETFEDKVEYKETKIKPVYKICGQVFATYIIVEKDGKMLMVDQHAAHERLRYEKLLEQFRSREITSQLLLSPVVITLTAPEFACFVENKDAINDLGFITDVYGQKQIIVRGTPAEAGECDAESTISEIINMLLTNRKNIGDDLASKMLYRIACRGAVKANALLSGDEMAKLLDDVFSLKGINTCPHGRPITIEFTKDFIEKQFKRIV